MLWLIAHFTQKALQEKTKHLPNSVSDTSIHDHKVAGEVPGSRCYASELTHNLVPDCAIQLIVTE